MTKSGPVVRSFLSMARRFVLAGLVLVGITTTGSATDPVNYWSDPQNGFAIGGYDPVAYFVEGTPRPGILGQEFVWQGVAWRFANEGNRAAFAADPEIYSPRFGGFDPVAVSRGDPAEGNPYIWAIYKGNLLLFHSQELKTLWELDQEGILKVARTKWSTINLNGSLD